MQQRRFMLAMFAAAVLPAAGAVAAIIPKASTDFPTAGKFEMNTAVNEVSDTGSTSTWTRLTGGTVNSTLSGGVMNLDTSSADGAFGYWYAVNSWSSATAATGWTVEISARIDSSTNADRTFDLWTGDGSKTFLLTFGPGSTRFGLGYSVLLNADNSNDFHVFRVAKDAGTDVFQVWRDGVQIGINLPTTGFVDHDLYFGDGTGSFSGVGAFEYIRFDTTGAYSPVVPEPASFSLLGAAALILLRRRGASRI